MTDWMQVGIEALKIELPALAEEAPEIGGRLAELLYERLPWELRRELGSAGGLLEILGQSQPEDPSVGYPTLRERCRLVLAHWEGSEEEAERLAERATDCFLHAAGAAIDPGVRPRLRQCLPHDIQDRMFA